MMKSIVLTAIAIVAAGTAAGAVANATWYKQPWIKPPAKVTDKAMEVKPAAREQKPGVDDKTTTEVAAESTPSNPCEMDPEKPGVIGMACALHFLETGGAYFIDAREDHDFEEGHLKPAIHVPSSAIFENIPSRVMGGGISASDYIIVYCGGGQCEASHNVADALRNQFGYESVYVYEKGWEEIEASGKFGAYIVSGGSN